MCFSWKTHENIGGSLSSVQYNSDIWIFKIIPNVAFVNKCFGKKGTSETGFYCLLSCLLGSRSTEDAHRGAVRQQPRVLPAHMGQGHSPALNRAGKARMVRGAHPLTGLIVRQQHGDWVNSGIHLESPASKGSKAQGSMQAHHWDGSGQKQDLRAHLRQSYLKQSSQGENHKCNKTDATFNDSGQ